MNSEMGISSNFLAESMRFYRDYDLSSSLYQYAHKIAFEKDIELYQSTGLFDWFENEYADFMRSNFYENILFASELKQFVYDDNGNLLPINEIIFQKLRLYAAKCRLLDMETKR